MILLMMIMITFDLLHVQQHSTQYIADRQQASFYIIPLDLTTQKNVADVVD